MKVINIKKIKPLGGMVIVTANRYSEEECTHSGIIDSKKLGSMKEFQEIVCLGDMASSRGLNVGDKVAVKFDRFVKTSREKKSAAFQDIKPQDEQYGSVERIELNMILLDYVEHIKIDYSDIEFIVDDFTEDTEGEGLVTGNKELKKYKSGLIL